MKYSHNTNRWMTMTILYLLRDFYSLLWVYLVSIAVKRITIQSNEIRPQYNTLCCENDPPRDISVECKIIAHEIAHCRLKDFFFAIVGISVSIDRLIKRNCRLRNAKVWWSSSGVLLLILELVLSGRGFIREDCTKGRKARLKNIPGS